MTGILVMTGASRGIGTAAALAGARAGYAVTVHFGTHGEEAEQVCDQIRSEGSTAVAFDCDLGSEPAIVRLFATVDAKLGAVTALVNNAGVNGRVKVGQRAAQNVATLG